MKSSPKYDFLIVGAGLYGAVFAHEATKHGKNCLVIDKRNHLGGNTYCEDIEGINVHKYGAHIFHTNDKTIWDYVNSFVPFNRYTNSPLANFEGKLYNLPFNMNTFYQLWGTKTPDEAMAVLDEQTSKYRNITPTNLEEQALSLVGDDIYKKLIKGYTEKQWGRKATELPAFIIKRLPLRFTYDNNYFNDTYQGIPIGGYNKLTEGLLKGIECRTNIDFFKEKAALTGLAKQIVFTGKIDEYFDYCHGKLEYRSLDFKHEILAQSNYQGNAVVNYTEAKIPFTRIIEHKHFEFGRQKSTVITKEYPLEASPEKEPYYPINDTKNNEIFKAYQEMAKNEPTIFGGRLAEYKYYDMHQVIGAALSDTRKLFNEKS
ncbi:UDP-galactopyranose mutase [Muricauda oceani]|uniref:UDP-galactopyranose mutase n=1 Tax=Flagellimonas oceani TaxID=2698672 RepID=A0A6G7J3K1_9FLAO|nr:UDP-galactopyranose mutase [Allomuricauda oceani]MBW8243276.1 UDP-galactopyranose mutase [Allomuricauda oceani]QII45250.1 UDP-galactopyranose mutase [Allomuricauda oceani]